MPTTSQTNQQVLRAGLSTQRPSAKNLSSTLFGEDDLFINQRTSLFKNNQQFVVKLLKTCEDFDKYYQLRYQVFCLQHGWMPPNPFEEDMDSYDKHVDFAVGVFDRQTGNLLGGQRCIRSPQPFMCAAEGVFSDDLELKTGEDIGEYSMWVIREDFLNASLSSPLWKTGVMIHLLKMFFLESMRRGIRFIYWETTPLTIEIFRRRGFSLNRGISQTVIDEVEIELVLMDWQAFKEINANHPMLTWFYDGF